jgi:predicted metal-dependent phosphoesterase TrpH
MRGVELSTTVGHILVFGVTSDCWKTPYSRTKLSPQAVLDLVDAVSGAAVIAHPFKPGYQFHAPEILEHPRVCALETCNGQCLDIQNQQARLLARQYSMPETGGSDAHLLHEIGMCYTLFDRPIFSENDLIAALLGGAVQGKSMKQSSFGEGDLA